MKALESYTILVAWVISSGIANALSTENSKRSGVIRTPRTRSSSLPEATANDGATPSTLTLMERPALNVLIPAFNEEHRIRLTLEDIDAYLAEVPPPSWNEARLVVVDDGSTDKTRNVVNAVGATSRTPMECIRLDDNQGKGAALSFGMQYIYQNQPQSLVLIADADGSGDIRCLENLYSAMLTLLDEQHPSSLAPHWNHFALVAGYRMQQGQIGSRISLRRGFRFAVRTIVGDLGVRDTQCGFKLMTATAGNRLYSNLSLNGWSHDVEVLYKCRELGIPLAEAQVDWQDMAGSKLAASPGGIAAVTLQMLLDLIRIRLFLSTRWKNNGR